MQAIARKLKMGSLNLRWRKRLASNFGNEVDIVDSETFLVPSAVCCGDINMELRESSVQGSSTYVKMDNTISLIVKTLSLLRVCITRID